MSAPPPAGRPNGLPPRPKPKSGGPLRPNRPKPSLFAPKKRPNVAPPKVSNDTNNVPPQKSLEQRRRENGGWSEPRPDGASDIPIMMSKRELLNGIRYHMMKLNQARSDSKPHDPTDDDEFARPVTLHRRDPRQPPAARQVKVEERERTPVDELEAERLAQLKVEKEAQKAIDQAKIAPVAKDPNPKPKKKQKEEKTQFHRIHKSEAHKKEADIRYEEALPWHLEDADGKNVWVGSYQAALSGNQVAFKIDGAVFRMIPIEKYYSFASKPSFKVMSIEEAEDVMGKKMDAGRWFMKNDEKRAEIADMEATRRYLGAGSRMVKTESSTFKAASRAEKMEHDDLDVSGDEFQDDDEAATFERNNDEDEKESKERIRREQLGANLFGEGDENQVEREIKEELQEEEDRKKYGKSTKKALIKRDREDVYESDNSEDNPWSSSDDNKSSDDDDEDNEDEDVKKEEDKDDKDGVLGSKDSGDKDKAKASGSKTSTPLGKKAGDSGKKGKGIKRPGSPALSESSGNESTKKKKIKTGTPAIGSRAGTPSLQQAAIKRKAQGGAGSGSDGEATGGEMSDGAVARKKIKLKGTGAKGTPSASRAGSPQGSPPPGSPNGRLVEPSEILERIPPDGITIGDLIKFFAGRVGEKPGQMPKTEWIRLVKGLCDYGPDKRLRKKT